MFSLHRLTRSSPDSAPAFDSKSRDEPTVDLLPAQHPLEFDPIMATLPRELPIGDPRLAELVSMLHVAHIDAIDTPISLRALPRPDEVKRRIEVSVPDGLREGADPLEYSLPIPLDAFVAAPEVIDWRTGRQDAKNGVSSAKVIRQYAGRLAHTAVPIQHVRVFIRPDGAVYATLVGDGAHRLCAAKLRGDTDILCREVEIIQL